MMSISNVSPIYHVFHLHWCCPRLPQSRSLLLVCFSPLSNFLIGAYISGRLNSAAHNTNFYPYVQHLEKKKQLFFPHINLGLAVTQNPKEPKKLLAFHTYILRVLCSWITYGCLTLLKSILRRPTLQLQLILAQIRQCRPLLHRRMANAIAFVCLFPFQTVMLSSSVKAEPCMEGGWLLGKRSGNTATSRLPKEHGNMNPIARVIFPKHNSDHVQACPSHSMLLLKASKIKSSFLDYQLQVPISRP